MNSVKTKFEKIAAADDDSDWTAAAGAPKPVRSITPPRDGANRVEIENEPQQRPADVASAFEKLEDTLPDSGYIRARKEIFAAIAASPDSSGGGRASTRQGYNAASRGL